MIPALLDEHAPSGTTAGFWAASAQGEFVLQHCLDCTNVQHPPRATCTRCGSVGLEFRPSSGHGTVYSFTVVERGLIPELRAVVPYVLGLIDLDDGPRVMSLLRVAPEDVAIDMRVRVDFERVTEEVVLPVFVRPS